MALRSFLFLMLAVAAFADEGFWTYNNFPAAEVEKRYGFRPDGQWLDHLRLSSLRINGCSASFVSPEGLVMTNHHCVRTCVSALSRPGQDYLASGFASASPQDEQQCPAMHADRLESITDVTGRVSAAGSGLSGQKFADAVRTAKSEVEKECLQPGYFCEVVTMYGGARHDLYRYRRWTDLRLVFAPEADMAGFGGDPDNFSYPRFAFDVAFLRVYDSNGPVRPEHFLRWSATGASEGDLVFASGSPGSSNRLSTVAQLEYLRDIVLPRTLAITSEFRGWLSQFQVRGPEQKRIADAQLSSIENTLKRAKGQHAALADPEFMGTLRARETTLQRLAGPKDRSAWDDIATAMQRQRGLSNRDYALNSLSVAPPGYARALSLLRYVEERVKPPEQRLRAYNDARLPAVRASVLSKAPVYDELEIERLTFWLTKLRELLGPDDPVVRSVLGKRSPRQLAVAVMAGTKMKDPAFRATLIDMTPSQLASVSDPALDIARAIDPAAREVAKRVEAQVDAPVERAGDRIGNARFRAFGTRVYPDGTGTPRLTFGQIRGHGVPDGSTVPPFTTIGGLFDRATGSEPFQIPASWQKARSALASDTPLNFIYSVDTIGGNSGSPVVNRAGEVVGINFDSNAWALGRFFGYEPERGRSIAVDTRAIAEALEKVYGAKRILHELRRK